VHRKYLAEEDVLFHIIDQKYRQMDFSTLWSHILRKTPAAEFAQIKALVSRLRALN
jgi:hypothetical protein